MTASIFGLGACSGGGGGETPFPAPPAVLTQSDEYPWGDNVAGQDERLAQRASTKLGERYGKPREDHYVAAAGTDLTALEGQYQTLLGEGWSLVPLDGVFRPGEGGFAFGKGDRALAVLWLRTQPDGRTPVTISRFGER